MAAIGLVPEVSEVGAILRARTRDDDSGDELGTFIDGQTRPSGTQVEEYIQLAATIVGVRVPNDAPANLVALARLLIVIRAAMEVELSFDPDRTGDESAYNRLKEQYDEGMDVLLGQLGESDSGRTGKLASIALASPYGASDALSELDFDFPL